MSFIIAVEKVLAHEGGFVNHPADRGGPTNFGITQKTYSDFKKRPVTVEEVKNMPRSEAVQIYKQNYWDKILGDNFKFYSVAFVVFDQAVNRGVSSAVKQAQRIVGTTQDGSMGPVTLAAINAMGENDFISRYLAASLTFYDNLVSKDSSQSAFIKGWRNRISSIEDYVSQYVGKENTTAALSITGLVFVGLIFFLILMLAKKK